MSDLTFKEARLIRTGDLVMSFNHETGRIEPNRVIANDHLKEKAEAYEVVHLTFSNGNETDFVYEQAYFDVDLNKYVYLHSHDAKEYIGHQFIAVNEQGIISRTKLIDVSSKEEIVEVVSPVTANHLNIVADNMLSVGGGLAGLFNIFDYDRETLAFHSKKKGKDIKQYGLLGYEAFSKFFPQEIYDALPCKYMSVSIGKGLITREKIEEYISQWKAQLLENIK